jgi:group I intron endonuclease
MERIHKELRKSGVYRIVSVVNNRMYIGSTMNLIKRKNAHFCSLRKGSHWNPQLQEHFNTYGESDLCFSILEYCSEEERVAREQFYIDNYNPSFNVSRNAFAPMKDMHHTNDALKKISESSKRLWLDPAYREFQENKVVSLDTRNKMRDSHIGKKQSQSEIDAKKIRVKKLWQTKEYRDSHIRGLKNRIQSEEHKRKNSEAQKLWWADPENRKRQRESRLLRWQKQKTA